MAKRKFSAINPRDVKMVIDAQGTLKVEVPITSVENGTEGKLTMTLTNEMGLRFVWDGVGLSSFEAWSTQ